MTLLVSYHGNRESEAALELAIDSAQRFDRKIVVLLSRSQGHVDPSYIDEVEAGVWQRLNEASLGFSILRAPTDLSLADTVLEAAGEVGAELIVLGLRPGGSALTNIGPNAARIMLDATCPVLTTSVLS